MHFKLIIALVEDSKTALVLDAARQSGATGSTVINHARGEGIETSKTFFGLTLETQRDMLLFLVEDVPDTQFLPRQMRYDRSPVGFWILVFCVWKSPGLTQNNPRY